MEKSLGLVAAASLFIASAAFAQVNTERTGSGTKAPPSYFATPSYFAPPGPGPTQPTGRTEPTGPTGAGTTTPSLQTPTGYGYGYSGYSGYSGGYSGGWGGGYSGGYRSW
jgi:hypothetical protein